jgi:hypothetical protein
VDSVWSVAAGAGIAVSRVPLVCQCESHKARLVVELFVRAAILFQGLKGGLIEKLYRMNKLKPCYVARLESIVTECNVIDRQAPNCLRLALWKCI